MIEVVSLHDRGLDLVLGGGLRKVPRVDGRHGTVLLVRGAAGTGKTLVGFHAARSLAEAYQGVIAYACIELLPTELEAQLCSWLDDPMAVVVRHPGSASSRKTTGHQQVIEASLFEVGEEPMALGAGIERFVSRLQREGRAPGVLVIDSLIEGYGIGSSASREFVDAVCKLAAAWGIGVVLLEESEPGRPSPWTFAVDTVLELSLTQGDGDRERAFDRMLTVPKHRFGPSDAGPHRLAIEPGLPLRLDPRPGAWLAAWTTTLPAGVEESPKRDEGEGRIRVATASRDDAWVGLVVAVFGPLPKAIFELALGLRTQREQRDGLNRSLLVSFTRPLGNLLEDEGQTTLGVAHPYLSPHRLVRTVLDTVQSRPHLQRLILADLRALRSFVDEDSLRRAVGVLCLLARRRGLAVVLVESTAGRHSVSWVPGHAPMAFPAPGVAAARCVDFADLAVEVTSAGGPYPNECRVTNLHSGRTEDVKQSVAAKG